MSHPSLFTPPKIHYDSFSYGVHNIDHHIMLIYPPN